MCYYKVSQEEVHPQRGLPFFLNVKPAELKALREISCTVGENCDHGAYSSLVSPPYQYNAQLPSLELIPPSIGASGNIGASVLAAVLAAHPDLSIDALVRSKTDAQHLKETYGTSVTTTIGSLADLDLLETKAAEATIVICPSPLPQVGLNPPPNPPTQQRLRPGRLPRPRHHRPPLGPRHLLLPHHPQILHPHQRRRPHLVPPPSPPQTPN